MQPKKFRILSAITAGSLALAVAAITASSSTGHTATRAALAAQTGSFPPADLDKCPTLWTGYPTGGCVAQLQTDLRIIQDPNLVVDGTFGPVRSQTWNAVTAFQTAHGLDPDGMVGPATKNALKAALPGPASSVPGPASSAPAPPASAPAPGTSDGSGAANTAPASTAKPATPTPAPGSNVNKRYVRVCGWVTCSIYYSHQATVQLSEELTYLGSPADVTEGASIACGIAFAEVPPVAAGCGALAIAAFTSKHILNIIDHAAATAGCVRFRSLDGVNDLVPAVYADHSAICHSMDS